MMIMNANVYRIKDAKVVDVVLAETMEAALAWWLDKYDYAGDFEPDSIENLTDELQMTDVVVDRISTMEGVYTYV